MQRLQRQWLERLQNLRQNNMKRLTVLILILVFLLSFVTKVAVAQSASLSIVSIEYQTREDIDFLFANSEQVLEYLEGIEIEKPTFLSLATEEQINTIKGKGYMVKILEKNANIDRFVLLYNPQPSQAAKLKPYGEPIIISSHYTLLKMPEGHEFTHEGESGRFFDIPFSKIISPPPLRTKTVLEIAPSQSEKRDIIGDNRSAILIFVVFLLVVSGASGYIIWRKKRQNSTQI